MSILFRSEIIDDKSDSDNDDAKQYDDPNVLDISRNQNM